MPGIGGSSGSGGGNGARAAAEDGVAAGCTAINAPFCPQAETTIATITIAQKANTSRRAHTLKKLRADILRILKTMTSAPAAFEPLSAADYERRTRAVFAAIEASVDRFLEDDIIDIDAGRTGGLLELGFPNGSKIVVNTQPPLQEVWLAAQSGGFHFKALGDAWVDTRSGREFFELLSACASEQGGKDLVFPAAMSS